MKKTIFAVLAATTMLSGAAHATTINSDPAPTVTGQHVNGQAGDNVISVENQFSDGTASGTTLYYSLDHFVAMTGAMSSQIGTLNQQLATSQEQAQYLANQRNAAVNAALYGTGIYSDAGDYTIDEMAADGDRGVNETTNRMVTTGGAVTRADEALAVFDPVLTDMNYKLTINGQVRRLGSFDVHVAGSAQATAVNILNELGATFDHGYELGYGDGWADGFDMGYEQGYNEGYAEGFEDGVDHGVQQVLAAMEAAN